MPEDKEVLDTRPLFKGLVSDWRQRLLEQDPFTTPIPREGLFPREAAEIANLYEKVNPLSSSAAYAQPNKDFYEAYRDYANKIRPVLSEALPSIQERFRQFSKNTGIKDYEPVSGYTRRPGDLFSAAQHEIYSHDIPYSLGFMPDYRAFDTGINEGGKRLIFGPNSVTPINESVATASDYAFGRMYAKTDPGNKWLENVFNPRNVALLEEAALSKISDPSERELLKARLELAYPSDYKTSKGEPMVFPLKEEASTLKDLRDISELYLDKYIKPASQQYEGAVRTQFPMNDFNMYYADYKVPQFSRALEFLDKQFSGSSRPSLFGPNSFFLSTDPVTAAVKGGSEFVQSLKRTPSALLPGAADLIPSPEAIRTGYREGPAAMGKQMGQEFIQSLPAAAGAAGILALPAVAPFAPGIGAGMVGVAGAQALNEVVRQQTGEGIVPKLRQVIGTAPRSGVASPPRQGPVVTPQIRPLTPAQQTEMRRRQNRNEIEKRIDLVRERFNPSKLEFGLSELLFGR